LKVKYADGLAVDWEEKEINKIAEIKARANRNTKNEGARLIRWEGRENSYLTLDYVKRIEIRRKKERALVLLSECGYPIIRIAEMFNMTEKEMKGIIRRGALGQL